MLKLVFGNVPKEFANEGKYFKAPNGELKYYQLEIDSDTVRLVDTVGRYFPIGVEELDVFINALYLARDLTQVQEDMNAEYKARLDELVEAYNAVSL